MPEVSTKLRSCSGPSAESATNAEESKPDEKQACGDCIAWVRRRATAGRRLLNDFALETDLGDIRFDDLGDGSRGLAASLA